MAKKKFELSNDMISIPDESEYEEITPLKKEKEKQKSEEKINFTIRISPSLKKELKMWCLMNNMSISDATAEAIKLLASKK